jgi:hypothetical protein
MRYTRRRILRDAVRVSMGAAAVSSLPSLSAFATDQQPSATPPPCGSDAFCSGIRVFFIGAWLFLGETDQSGMLAVTRDMHHAHLHHTFPYGVWPNFDNTSSLGANPAVLGQPREAYPITVSGVSTNHKCAQDVFAEAEKNSSFNYITAKGADLKLKAWLPRIRVISLPYPTRIIPADSMHSITIDNKDGNHPWNKPNKPYGYWAAHIFEYLDGRSLSFKGTEMISQGSTDSTANFHFHTLPPQNYHGSPHAPMMFKNLLSVIEGLDPRQFTLKLPPGTLSEAPGPYVPTSLQRDREELCLPKCPRAYCPLISNTASCASSGGGIGGH